jgi:hypothetical protein
MIKEVQMYTVICDNCGKDCCEGSEYSCWNDSAAARDVAMDDNWTEDRDFDKHYCPDCWSYDDQDNVIINESRKKLIL